VLERYRVQQVVCRIVYEIGDTDLFVQIVKIAHRLDA